jgi:pyruvate formate lyase activating enzyme
MSRMPPGVAGSPTPRAVVFDPLPARDAPRRGIETFIRFKGCDLRCAYCDVPEGLRPTPEPVRDPARCTGCGACVAACPAGAATAPSVGARAADSRACRGCGACVAACPSGARRLVGRFATLESLVRKCLRRRGPDGAPRPVRLTGGEPLRQDAFLAAFLPQLRAKKVHVTLETSGAYPWERLEPLLPYLDLVAIDYKLPGDGAYRHLAGAGHGRTLDTLATLVALEFPVAVRVPAIPALNTHPSHIALMAAILTSLDVRRVQLLPYRSGWEAKLPRLETERQPLGLHGDDVDLTRLAAFYAMHGIHAERP